MNDAVLDPAIPSTQLLACAVVETLVVPAVALFLMALTLWQCIAAWLRVFRGGIPRSCCR